MRFLDGIITSDIRECCLRNWRSRQGPIRFRTNSEKTMAPGKRSISVAFSNSKKRIQKCEIRTCLSRYNRSTIPRYFTRSWGVGILEGPHMFRRWQTHPVGPDKWSRTNWAKRKKHRASDLPCTSSLIKCVFCFVETIFLTFQFL